jgi:hypothetical protein
LLISKFFAAGYLIVAFPIASFANKMPFLPALTTIFTRQNKIHLAKKTGLWEEMVCCTINLRLAGLLLVKPG